MRLPGRHHRNRHTADSKTAAPPSPQVVRFDPSVRTAGELVAERKTR